MQYGVSVLKLIIYKIVLLLQSEDLQAERLLLAGVGLAETVGTGNGVAELGADKINYQTLMIISQGQ